MPNNIAPTYTCIRTRDRNIPSTAPQHLVHLVHHIDRFRSSHFLRAITPEGLHGPHKTSIILIGSIGCLALSLCGWWGDMASAAKKSVCCSTLTTSSSACNSNNSDVPGTIVLLIAFVAYSLSPCLLAPFTSTHPQSRDRTRSRETNSAACCGEQSIKVAHGKVSKLYCTRNIDCVGQIMPSTRLNHHQPTDTAVPGTRVYFRRPRHT